MTQESLTRPITFLLAKWYGYVFSAMFILYGGVKIILGVLDRDYSDMSQSVIFLIAGAIMITVSFAFRDLKRWGWYGLVALNGIVVLLVLFSLGETLNLVFLVLSGAVLGALFAPPTKTQIFG
ncbi:MAG: hypothetical protein GY867_06970 [bacterium]|nr:hypothetical protein [bacterium]